MSAQSSTDTLVIGAGPYGLSLSAHLRRAGVEHVLLGRPMDVWNRMPTGMCLRSPVRASSLSDPEETLTLEVFHAERGLPASYPVPLELFNEYGRWFIDRAGIEVDQRFVTNLSRSNGSFEARLEDGERIEARRVVLAAGAEAFRWVPPEFRDLPPGRISHAADHEDLSMFAGKELAIVGAGQSAIEYAALAHEQGANVRLIFRARRIRWLTRSARLHSGRLVRSLLYAPADVGPAGLSRIVSAPELFRMLPASARRKAVRRCTRPAAAAWLIDRTSGVAIQAGTRVSRIDIADGRVRIECVEADAIDADHVMLATGYEVDLARYSFIASELVGAVKAGGGFPALGRGMSSSVSGLHITGWPATGTYGPLMRHVAGVAFSSRALTGALRVGGSSVGRLARRPGRQYHFDPSTYLAQASANIPHYRQLQSAVAAATRGLDADLILDLGIGTGETAAAVLCEHPGALLTGLDASPGMLAAARSRLPPANVAALLIGKLEDPLPPSEFDLIVSSLAVHHLRSAQKRELFRRVARALAPGGRFVMGDIVRPTLRADAVTPISRIHDRPERAADLRRWLTDAGFDVSESWSRGDLIVLRATKGRQPAAFNGGHVMGSS